MVKINYNSIHIALPAMDELGFLPNTLKSIKKQDFKNFTLYVCVNQPDDWWNDPEKIKVCENNHKTLQYLKTFDGIKIKVIDKSSKGYGWIGKQSGVGWARKYLMDYIVKLAKPEDIIVSMDADTIYESNYLSCIMEAFDKYNDIVAISAPYYHQLKKNFDLDSSILRYEIYMRYYLINLFRIGSPYAFTALGSAISVPVWVYLTVSGITPKHSGEDFYFLQKLKKYGKILNYLPTKVYPETRFSDRVIFGTGPAISQGLKGNWESYPIFNFEFFDEIKETYNLLPRLFERDLETTFTYFLKQQFSEEDLWGPLRDNFKNKELFIKACHEKMDGLRILQFLKYKQKRSTLSDEEAFKKFVFKFKKDDSNGDIFEIIDKFSYKYTGIFELNKIRDFLVQIEDKLRKAHLESEIKSHHD